MLDTRRSIYQGSSHEIAGSWNFRTNAGSSAVIDSIGYVGQGTNVHNVVINLWRCHLASACLSERYNSRRYDEIDRQASHEISEYAEHELLINDKSQLQVSDSKTIYYAIYCAIYYAIL